jgi:integrase
MATITKRGPNQWQAKIRRKGYPSLSHTADTRDEAEEWAKLTEADMIRGLYLPRRESESTTLSDVADRFQKEFAPHHYRGAGWKAKLEHVRAYLGKYALATINSQLVGSYRDYRLTQRDSRYKKNLDHAPLVSPATVKGELDLLSKLLDVVQKEFGIALPHGNPARNVRKPSASNRRNRRLEGDEWERLVRECGASQNHWLLPAVRLAVETGMRQSEPLNLMWDDVDLDAGVAYLQNHKTKKDKQEAPRPVPLSSAARAILSELPHSISGRVIATDRGTLYKAFKRACERAGIHGLTYHDLRHEALSRLGERGDLSIPELAAISGHKSWKMLERYVHLQAINLAKKLG